MVLSWLRRLEPEQAGGTEGERGLPSTVELKTDAGLKPTVVWRLIVD